MGTFTAERSQLHGVRPGPKDPNSSSSILSPDVVENLLERPIAAGRVFRQDGGFQPAFALRPRPVCYWRAHTEFASEMFEQDLLFRMGKSVHGGFYFGERAHTRKFVGKIYPLWLV